ncbi:hypothetical protein [Enterococcus faecalis]|uniref:hypothetical protein n=1 Tax=Enterococcus faecalis TaxID=1351 RepID=UPI0001B2BB05|nr:hypothetical protein [Enterococcus faecalis]EEU69760.1 predicted protein [Enterococcus faecalis HIP11704]EGO5823261.1 hypothetical protein [Enterococcus faecalis]EGO9069167.1 hypothetical protein [Enterococcus faecalis]EOL88514.1 hypothetical protein UMY_00914 [Enterococcus faecalis EnGen0283]KDE18113.1 hypothetical protein HMPREF2097_00825 [Enterococcus faecalis 918]
MSKEQSLIIWNQNGSTMKFEKVNNFKDIWQAEQIYFEYFGVSTKKRRRATFYTRNIAGYALEMEEAE